MAIAVRYVWPLVLCQLVVPVVTARGGYRRRMPDAGGSGELNIDIASKKAWNVRVSPILFHCVGTLCRDKPQLFPRKSYLLQFHWHAFVSISFYHLKWSIDKWKCFHISFNQQIWTKLHAKFNMSWNLPSVCRSDEIRELPGLKNAETSKYPTNMAGWKYLWVWKGKQ
jgi:hypothetical protein